MTQYEAAIYGIDVSEYDQETDYIEETNGIDEIVNINENGRVENESHQSDRQNRKARSKSVCYKGVSYSSAF